MRSAPNIYAWRQMSNERPLWEVRILMGTSVMCRDVVASMSPRIGITGESKKKKQERIASPVPNLVRYG